MALPDTSVLQVGTQISFADHAGDFAPAASATLEQGTPTDVQLSLASVADAAARQSAKVDLGASRAPFYDVMAVFEFAATPVAGDVVELYWAPSPSATAGNANPGNVTGADAAFTGTPSTLAVAVAELQHIGNFKCTEDPTAVLQTAYIGSFCPTQRYGTLVVKNESAAAFHSDDVECHVVLTPIIHALID